MCKLISKILALFAQKRKIKELRSKARNIDTETISSRHLCMDYLLPRKPKKIYGKNDLTTEYMPFPRNNNILMKLCNLRTGRQEGEGEKHHKKQAIKVRVWHAY